MDSGTLPRLRRRLRDGQPRRLAGRRTDRRAGAGWHDRARPAAADVHSSRREPRGRRRRRRTAPAGRPDAGPAPQSQPAAKRRGPALPDRRTERGVPADGLAPPLQLGGLGQRADAVDRRHIAWPGSRPERQLGCAGRPPRSRSSTSDRSTCRCRTRHAASLRPATGHTTRARSWCCRRHARIGSTRPATCRTACRASTSPRIRTSSSTPASAIPRTPTSPSRCRRTSRTR